MGMKPHKPRIVEIDRAKGLAILLVVVGHVVARTPPLDNHWYEMLKELIYLFHMPFFMFLSGFVMAYSYRPVASFDAYLGYAREKFIRLMPAFFAVAGFILIGKTLASQFMHVDNMPYGLLNGLLDILLRPADSSAGSLWYIYVLFIYYLIFPVLIFVSRGALWPLLFLGVVAYFSSPVLTHTLMLNRVAEFAPFLVIGMMLSRNYDFFTSALDRFGGVALMVFIFFLLAHQFLPYPKLVLGLLSIPALLFFVRLPGLRDSATLLTWGHYVFSIYLFNTLFIGLVKGVGIKLAPWDGTNFLFFFPVLLAAGMLLPIIFKKAVLVRYPLLDRLTT